MIDLDGRHLAIVRTLLGKHVGAREVRAFGSRVTGRARRYSDLDLVVMGDTALPREVLDELAEAFSDSDLPMRVDLLDWQRLSPRFRQVIDEASEVVCPDREAGATGPTSK